MKLTEITSETCAAFFTQADDNSYYTIVGVGGPVEEWMNGYNELMEKEGIGKVDEFFSFYGKDMNEHYELTDSNAYPNDLRFLAFAIDNLNVGKLAIFKLRMQDKWFDDIVCNNNRRQVRIDDARNA